MVSKPQTEWMSTHSTIYTASIRTSSREQHVHELEVRDAHGRADEAREVVREEIPLLLKGSEPPVEVERELGHERPVEALGPLEDREREAVVACLVLHRQRDHLGRRHASKGPTATTGALSSIGNSSSAHEGARDAATTTTENRLLECVREDRRAPGAHVRIPRLLRKVREVS